MQITKHLSGKHYAIHEAPWIVLFFWERTGIRLGKIKTKVIYKGVK